MSALQTSKENTLTIKLIDDAITNLSGFAFLDRYSELMEMEIPESVYDSSEFNVLIDNADNLLIYYEEQGKDVSRYKTSIQYLGIEE